MRFEPYNDKVKSLPINQDFAFQLATHDHLKQILEIAQERNLDSNIEKLNHRFQREIDINSTNTPHRIFVALNQSEVLGFCRYFHSKQLDKKKLLYDSPTGFYNMGITVKKGTRRKGVGTFLSSNRDLYQISQGIKEIYSGVSAENPSSIKFHEKQGFACIGNIAGFLHVAFDCKNGILFKKYLNTHST